MELDRDFLHEQVRRALSGAPPAQDGGHKIKVTSTVETITKKDARGNEYKVTGPLVGALAKQFPLLSRRERKVLMKRAARAAVGHR